MSAFLGPIHYWMFSKIRRVIEREQLLYASAARTCGDLAEELRVQVWQTYGSPLPDKDLGEMIDQANIHGWLQKQVNIAETREAAFIRELIDACGDAGHDLAAAAFAEHGAACGCEARQQGKYDASRADSIYKALNDYFLNGMPCDQADMVTESSPQKVVWEAAVCLQEPNWKRAGVSAKLMKELYQAWLQGFAQAMNPACQYRQTADTLQGDPVNRHEFVIA
ncbi:MAG: hypothetical protein N2491_08285 [Negativicutes bacterium]|nr:hypothetical protein [Negativicutes bacterium]